MRRPWLWMWLEDTLAAMAGLVIAGFIPLGLYARLNKEAFLAAPPWWIAPYLILAYVLITPLWMWMMIDCGREMMRTKSRRFKVWLAAIIIFYPSLVAYYFLERRPRLYAGSPDFVHTEAVRTDVEGPHVKMRKPMAWAPVAAGVLAVIWALAFVLFSRQAVTEVGHTNRKVEALLNLGGKCDAHVKQARRRLRDNAGKCWHVLQTSPSTVQVVDSKASAQDAELLDAAQEALLWEAVRLEALASTRDIGHESQRYVDTLDQVAQSHHSKDIRALAAYEAATVAEMIAFDRTESLPDGARREARKSARLEKAGRLEALAEGLPDSYWSSRALKEAADVNLAYGDVKAAKKQYKRVIALYPNTVAAYTAARTLKRLSSAQPGGPDRQ